MTFRLSSSQQRIEGTGSVPQGPWTSATYGRANGVVTVTSIAHRLNTNERLYVKPGSDNLLRTFDEGQYTITVVDEDTFTISGTGQNFIEAATVISYRSVRSLVINASDRMELSVGTGANEDDAVFITKSDTGNIRVGINNTNPEFDLDVEGQIRTTRSIISDTAQIRNLDVQNEFVTKGLDLRGPNLINFEETDPTANDFGTVYYPTADNPPRQTQNNRVATTKFVYDVATADNGGRVYVSSVAGIGDDANDGRSAAKPVRTIKKAAQIAYSLQQDTQTPEYVSIIVSGGEYLEDNPISLPFNCSLIGDNLRRVILRPLNMDRHMIKASNETYCAGVVFRDHLDASGQPDWTWKYAYVFDDKQRLMYEPDLAPFEFSPGLENKGRNIFAITFENHTGDNTTLLVGYAVEGGSSSARAIIEQVTFTGPQASPYSSGTVIVLMDDDESTFQLAERLYYADVYANIVKTGASPSDSLDVADRESQRPETEVIKHQRYQWVVNSEEEKLRFDGSSDTIVDATNNEITIPFHRLETGWKVFYTVENEGGTSPQGLVKNTTYFVRKIDDNKIALYDTAVNALNIQVTTGVRDLGDPGTGDEHSLYHSRIFTRDNTIYFPKHGLFTGNGVYYRPSKAGNIGGLVTNSLIYVYKIDDNYFQLCNTQADATSKDIGGNDTPVVLPLTDVGKGYQRFEKAINVVDVATVTTDLATQQTYNGIKLTVTGASRTIEGIPFVGHDYEVGQEVQVYGLPYTAIDFGTSATTTYTQSTDTITITIANTDPSKMNALWPNLTTIGGAAGKGVGIHCTFSGTDAHQSKSFHIAQYANGTLAQTQSDFATVLGGSSNLGAGVARYNSSTNEAYFVIRASDSATRSGNCAVLDNLGDFNGRKYVTHRIERADGYSLNFCTRGSCSKFATDFDPAGDQQVCSATNYALMSLRNSPYAFEKVEFGSSIQEMAKSRDAAETLNNNVDFIAIESYAHIKKLYNAGTSTSFTRSGTYTCSGKVMTVVCGRGHGAFAKNSYSMVFSGATPDGAYIIDDTADHRTFTILLSTASTDSGTVTVTIPAPWQTPNSVPPVDRSADGSSLILANKQFIAQEAVARMLANNPGYNVPTGSQACIDDAVDYIEAFTYNLAYGGNDQVWDGAKYYVDGSHVVGEENESVEVFNLVRDLAIQVTRNEPITVQGGHGLTQVRDYTITPDAAGSGQGNKHADARNLIWANKEFIADIAVGRMNADFGYEVHSNKHVDAHDLLIANKDFIAAEAYAWELAEDPTLHVPTGNGQDCIDDIADVVNAIAFNVQHGGNNKVWDAASYYVGTPHLDDEEFQSVRCFEHAREICKLVLANNTVVVRGDHVKTQTFDTTITHDSSSSSGDYTSADCTDVRATVDTLFEIIHSAILNDSLKSIKKVTPRPYKVPAVNKLTASGAEYNPATGVMTLRVGTDTKDVSAATFAPASGNLELNIGAHSLTTSDKIRINTGSLTFRCDLDGQSSDHAYPRTNIDYSTAASGTTYNPTTGVLSVTTTVGHGLQNGDWVKFADDSIVFECAQDAGKNHSYPRQTDPISGRWVEVSNVGGLTFEVQVLSTQPSTNTTVHTFVSATANGIWKKRDRAYEQDLPITAVSSTTITVNVGISSDTSTHVFQSATAGAVITSHNLTTSQYIKIANDSLTFTCGQNNGQTNMTYPKSSSTANQEGWSAITAVTVDTVDINVGTTTVEGFEAKNATYTASNGEMVVTIGANNFKVGQTINLAPRSINFTCEQDDNQTVHAYPRETDPYYSQPVEISAIGNSTSSVTDATFDPAEGKLTLTIPDHGMRQDSQIKIADGSLTFTCAHDSHATDHAYPRAEQKAITATDAAYNTATGIVTVTQTGHGLKVGEYIKVKDSALTFSCTHGGGGQSAYPRPSDPISGKWIPVTAVSGDTFSFKCLTTVPSTNTDTHTFVSATTGGIIKRDPDSDQWRHVQVVDKDTVNVCIATSSNETVHVFKSATANNITHKDSTITLNVGPTAAVDYTPTGATYDPTTGDMVLTINQHPDIVGATPHVATGASYDAVTGLMEIQIAGENEFNEGQFVRIPRDTFSFTCDMDGNASTKSYPRATDDAADWWLPIKSVGKTATGQYINVEVGKSPAKNFTVSDATYNPTSGDMELTLGTHRLVSGTAIRLGKDSLIFTCDFNSDGNTTQKTYPRATGSAAAGGKDYAYDTALNITAVGHAKSTSTDAAYNPTTGVMTLTVANHGFVNGDRVRIADDSLTFTCTEGAGNHSYPRASKSTHTAGNGTTYNPNTGVLVVDTGSAHNMVNGDWVKFNDNSLTFTCTHGGGNHSYPRSSDPMSGKWVQIESVSSTSFTVAGNKILDAIPSTNTTAHTFVSGATDGIVHKDPASGNFLTVSNVTQNTFDVQVLTSAPSTNTTVHTYVSSTANNIELENSTITVNVNGGQGAITDTTVHNFVASSKLQPTDASYNPTTGVMSVTIVGHGMDNGEYVKFDDNTFTFKCAHDSNTTDHTYPRPQDPASGSWLKVSNVTADTFEVTVLTKTPSTNETVHAFQSATAGVTRSQVRSGGAYAHTYVAPTDLTPTGATYNPTTGIMTLTIPNHGIADKEYVKLADGAVTFTCTEGAGNHSYPRATDPVSGKWIQTTYVDANSFSVQVLAKIPSTNTTTHTYVSAAANSVKRSQFIRSKQSIRLADSAVTFECDLNARATQHSYPRAALTQYTATNATYDANDGVMELTVAGHGMNEGDWVTLANDSVSFKCPYGTGTPHTWAGGTSYNAITVTAGSVKKDVTTATFDPANGLMELTIGAHSFTTSDTITIAPDAIKFTCNADYHQTVHSYPRSTDPSYNTAIAITAVTATTITANVGAVSGNVAKSYPRASDPIAGNYVRIFNVTPDTFAIQVLDDIPSTQTQVHTFVSAVTNGITHKRDPYRASAIPVAEVGESMRSVSNAVYNETTGVMTVTVTGHGLTTGNRIKFDKESLTFTCAKDTNATQHSYPRVTDPYYDKWLQVTQIDVDNFTVQVGTGGPNDRFAHTFVSATPGGIKLQDGTIRINVGKSTDTTAHYFVSALSNSVKTGGPYNHTFVPTPGITPTGADYNPTTGWMRITAADHGLRNGDFITVTENGLTFRCDHDSQQTDHKYPRKSDPLYHNYVEVRECTQNTFDFNVLQGTTPTNTTTHVFKTAVTGCIRRAAIKSGGNYPHRFVSASANGVEVSGDNQDCKDDVIDILQVVSWNLAMGGNDFTYDAANLYVTGNHLQGEEHHSIYALRQAQAIAIECFQNETVTTGGHTTRSQVKDLTITQDTGLPICNTVISSLTTLMNIIEVAIDTDSLSGITRTASHTTRCADVASTITTLTLILTNAIGTTGSPGNLTGVARTYPISDEQCIDDIRHVIRAWMYDLRYGGNSQTILSAGKYINGTNIINVNNEVTQTRQVYEKAKDMCVLAIRNQLPEAKFTDITPFSNASTTVDQTKPECNAMITNLTALHTILDNALNTPTSLAGVTNTPPSTMLKDDKGLKVVPMLGDLLDLPVIEASPYIQNSSLISFLGASGAEIDGAKVAQPNVPRPGVYADANGVERPTWPHQGKSMVANAFTIISVGGGVGYNILNDGYTQLVSVFVIFGGDGVIVQSGGYASLTNSASNFGTRSLKATGFRAEAYEFDIGTITNIINQTDNNGAQTGRQIIEVGGTTLTNFPVEDYIIKIDGYTNTDPSKEYFILGVEKLSGSIGTQVTANITTNDGLGLDLNRTSDNTQIAYSQGNLTPELVGKTIRFHRPSICNSSAHTWEYVGAGDTYLALPQNGGVGIPANEAVEEKYGQVYTSGTNEFGDFKVGDFVTIFNRTGSISFVGTVSISELSSIKIVGGSITITGFSDSDELGGAFASDSLLPTQAAVKDYITNKLGPYLNQPFSTNAVPSALVQLTTSGKINIEQIPALRPFNITSVASTAERLAIEDASAGDIAIETTSTTFEFAPSAVDTVGEYINIPAHGLAAGDALTYFQGTANVGNLADGATYYTIVHSVGANTTDYIKLATSKTDALAGTARDLGPGQGSGTHKLRTEGAAISYILENDLDTMYAAFTPDATVQYTPSNLVIGSASGAQGVIVSYDEGVVRDILVDEAGAGYASAPGITITAPGGGGTQATATCTITNGQVSTITITNPGSKYFTQPTVTFTAPPVGGTQATAQGGIARIEARLEIEIANNIKISDVDFMQEETNTTVTTGTYVHDTYDITVSETNHGFSQGDIVYLNFTSGSSPSGFYSITPVNANEYTVTAQISLLTSGNYERKKIIDVIRTVNTSAKDASNWTQLSSTNIDASNIVAGVIDPERLAATGTANSFTFLRGDSSYQYAIQSVKFSTDDCMVAESSLSDTSYIEKVDITVAGVGYSNGTYQNIPMLGGNVPISDAGVARATYTVADVTTGGIIDTVSNLNQTPGSYTASQTFDVAPSTTNGAGLGAQIRFTSDGVGTLTVDLVLQGGSGYSSGDTLTFDGPLFGGTVQQPVELTVSTLTSSQALGVITSVSVVTPGTGYNGDFVLTVPNELGTPSQAATLNAKKGVLPRYFGNVSIDLVKANKLTPTTLQAGGSVFGNYGITKFRKNVAEQALGDQTEGGFVLTVNGEVSIDQGAGSKLNADKLDGNEGAFYQNASNLVEGVIDPQRLANTTYNISISGTADFANVLFAETTAPSSANANLVSAANVGAQLALRSNSVNGIPTDAGGTRNGTLTFRRSATGNSVAQLAFSATDNLYIRGNSDTGTVYGNWAKIWHSENDGPPDLNEPRRGTLPGPNADFLDNQQGLWYQQGYNIHDQRTVGVLGDPALPTLLGRNKFVADNFYVVSSGEKYQLYVPNYFAATGTDPVGNLSAGGTYTIYADDAAVNNIGTITVDAGGINEVDDTTTGAKYTLVTGSIAFVGAYTNKDIRVFGPNPGSKWTVTSSNLLTTGASQVFALSNTANGALLEMGRAGIVSTPMFDIRTGGLSNDYDIRFEFSGGDASNGNGLIDIKSSAVTINSNTVWHSGNDGASSQLDAHYVDGWTQSINNTANTLVRRNSTNDIYISDLYADQGIFSNTGTSILQLADGNGINLGKATTNVLSIKGRQSSSVGYIRFGNDSNSFGWNGTHLSYNNVYFRNGRLGIGDSNPGVSLTSSGDAQFGSTGRSANTTIRALAGDSYQCGFEAYGNNQGTGYLYVGQSTQYGGGIAYNGDNSPGAFNSEQGDDITFYRRNNGTDTRVAKYRYNDSTFHFFGQIQSRVAQGTAPFIVASNTVVSNLNADLLDGYTATGLPYLGNQVNQWQNSNEGQRRFYFSNNSHTYYSTGSNYYWRNDADYSICSLSDGGHWTLYEPGSDQTQSSYRMQIKGDNGLDIDCDSVAASGGQRSVVLRADGSKQWVDRYGIIKRNNQTISESITINNGDSCASYGPLTVNNGYTISIASGGAWVIL